MRYIEFKEDMAREFTVFSLADIRQRDPAFHRRRLNEWQKKGYIRRVIKGCYIFSGLALDEPVLFEIANRIYAPSYVSFEMALAYHRLIPESVYGITSASTRKTMDFKTTVGEFTYRAIQPRLYFGFEYVPSRGRHCKIASPEKALLDYFYLHPDVNDARGFEGLRINREELLKAVDRGRMNSYLSVYAQKSLKKRIASFWEYIRHA